jgi:hypothetical protein
MLQKCIRFNWRNFSSLISLQSHFISKNPLIFDWHIPSQMNMQCRLLNTTKILHDPVQVPSSEKNFEPTEEGKKHRYFLDLCRALWDLHRFIYRRFLAGLPCSLFSQHLFQAFLLFFKAEKSNFLDFLGKIHKK